MGQDPDTPISDPLPNEAPPDESDNEESQPRLAFYERPLWRGILILAALVAMWTLIGLLFPTRYLRF